jgi:GNAT superfamily N-acetyltransferase
VAGAVEVRPVGAADRAVVDAFLADNHSDVVARRGELVDARAHEALLAEDGDGTLLGVATWIAGADEIELLTLHAARRWLGVGTALLEAVAAIGRARGCRRLWLVTTNDNVDALRFYQRRGLRLRALRAGAVDEARRTIKPAIPEIGNHGIPIRDELELAVELELALDADPGMPTRW